MNISHSLSSSQYVALQHVERRSFSSLPLSQRVSERKALLPLKEETHASSKILIIKAVGVDQIKGGAARGNRPIKLKAIVTIRRKHHHDYKEKIQEEVDKVSDAAGQKVTLQLVSNKIDPSMSYPNNRYIHTHTYIDTSADTYIHNTKMHA